MRYDLIVVGAGPAGSTAAREAASRGLSVLMLDRAEFPRDKPCGGGVNVRTARLLPFDLAPVTERVINSVHFSVRRKNGFVVTYPEPLTYLTQRSKLDAFLVEQAIHAGATLKERVTVRAVERHDPLHIIVRSGNDSFEGRTLIAADGANGTTAKLAGVQTAYEMSVALEGNISVKEAFPQQWDSVLSLDLGGIPGGYGWLFPKGDHVNIGVGGQRQVGPKLRALLDRQVRYYGYDPKDLQNVRGHHLPTRTRRSALADGNIALIGDAAGLIDPLTGEGIYAAVWSGRAAAREVEVLVNGKAQDLSGYARAVERELIPELVAATTLHYPVHGIPGSFTLLMQRYPAAWRFVCRMMRGEETYLTLKARLGPVWWPVIMASRLIKATGM